MRVIRTLHQWRYTGRLLLMSGLARPVFDVVATLGLTGISTDLADIFYDQHSRHLFLLGQESERIIETDLNGTVNEMRRFTVF